MNTEGADLVQVKGGRGRGEVEGGGVTRLVTVVNKVVVARLFGNRGRGLGNLDVF